MSPYRTAALTIIAMLAFAGNSLLCRLALKHTAIAPLTFTGIRLVAGAIALCCILAWSGRQQQAARSGSWWSAVCLFVYAAAFSLAYVQLTTGTGALLLFASVQVTMFAAGIWSGERVSVQKGLGLLVAMSGLIYLLAPGVSAPPLLSAAWMVASGIAWGAYSLRGRNSLDPLATTAGNFVKSLPFALLAATLGMVGATHARFDTLGLVYAVLSGAVTSGIGYAIWYRALKHLTATAAATVQLSVPVIAAVGGALWIGDDLSLRLAIGSAVVLGGIGISFVKRRAS